MSGNWRDRQCNISFVIFLCSLCNKTLTDFTCFFNLRQEVLVLCGQLETHEGNVCATQLEIAACEGNIERLTVALGTLKEAQGEGHGGGGEQQVGGTEGPLYVPRGWRRTNQQQRRGNGSGARLPHGELREEVCPHGE
jgi:hypothetical protein